MRTSTVLIAFAVAVACVLLAWATMPSRPGAALRAEPAETFALGFDVPSVGLVRVSSAGQSATLTREGLAWTLRLPTMSGDGATTSWPANPDAVRVLLNELATQAIESAGDWERVGRDEGGGADSSGGALATVAIGLPEGETTIAVTAAPIGGRLPVRIADPSGAVRRGFVVASRFRPTDVGQLAALADPRPFDTEGVVTQVRLTPREGAGFAIERVGGIWELAGGEPGESASRPSPRLHQPTVRAMLADLAAIRAASVIVPADLSGRGSADGDAFLTIETAADLPRSGGEGRERISASLTVAGQSTVDGLTNAIATRSGGEDGEGRHALQVRLDPQAFPALPADVGSLLDPVPLPISFADAARVRIAGARDVDLARSLDGWVETGGGSDGSDAARRPLDADETAALRFLFETLNAATPRVRPEARALGDDAATLIVESISGDRRIELRIEMGGEGEPITVFDGRAAWELDLDAPRREAFREALASLS